jgi:hypothetical protein
MPSMIETLIGAGISRPDEKRIVPTRRPLPSRPRDLLELFVTLGEQASLPSLNESCDLRQAEPRHMTYVALNRWPNAEELAAQPTPYNPRQHLRALLLGQEFRALLIRRICDAYPERPRLLYVRIPRCAGGHFTDMAAPMHPIFPPELARWARGDHATFIRALGVYLGRFNLTRTIMLALPKAAPFVQTTAPVVADKTLPWSLNPPPRRPSDRLFAIVREPNGLILSQVNAILTGLQTAPAHPDAASWATRLGALPPPQDTPAWKVLGRKVLAELPLHNPICHALGDGTAAGALHAVRLSDIEIADLTLYTDWVKYTWDVEPEPATNVSLPLLTLEDLDAAASTALAERTAEDRLFYAPVAAALAQLGDLKTAMRGRDL